MPSIKLTLPSPHFLCTTLLLLLLSPPSLAATGNCNTDDKNALLAIKSAFHNPEILSSWTDNTPCCIWAGIQCSAASNRVTSLRISASSTLSGSIPDPIADLPFLTTLIFSDLPRLTGPIPPSLARLPHLSTLILRNTSLSGFLPSFLSRIKSLQLLDLSYNRLTGSIPAELSLLRGLFLLRLSHNQLIGGIPAAFGRFNASSPPQLDLSNNLLSGKISPELGKPDWVFIDLSNNRLGGDASVLFGGRKRVTRMNLASNRFRFDLSRVSFPVNLGVLYMNDNEVYGSIPGQINQLTHLIVLNLSDNLLCGEIPAGAVTSKFGKEAYAGNRCLCGVPMGPCPESG